MKLKAYLFDDDRGVSPVIGVILMVAITVILAAVIATFVMNMGPPEETMPNAQFAFEDDSGTINLVHDGGESVKEANLNLKVSDSNSLASNSPYEASDIVVSDVTNGQRIVLVWENPNSDQTQVLFEGTAPSS